MENLVRLELVVSRNAWQMRIYKANPKYLEECWMVMVMVRVATCFPDLLHFLGCVLGNDAVMFLVTMSRVTKI